MNNCRYPNLFSQLIIGNTVFNNRIFASATGPTNLTSHNAPSPETCAQYERKAVGGAAAVCMGNCTVDTTIGRSVSSNIDLGNRSILPQLAKLATSITRHGAVPSIELQHAGSHSFGSWQEGNPIYGPVEHTDEQGRHILPMTEEIIERTIESFAQAAVLAKQSGFGMVTVHGGHGWLISQFVSPFSNTRTDRWGGSVENRCRLPVAICDAIKKAVGRDFPVEIRISGSECHSGGYDIDEGVAIARQLDGRADIIHVSAGSHEVREVFTVTHPSMFLEDGANVKYAAEIKKHIKKSFVATVGALADPDLMEGIIASGKADIIAVARGLLADPDLPLKARTGRENEINTCMRCLACFSNRIRKRQYLCAINPRTGRETEELYGYFPAKKRRILIAGGGIGGMQAALTASDRGHEVILCEKTDRLGGVLNCENGVPFKKNLTKYIARQAEAVARSGVRVYLSTEVTPQTAESFSPDVIIAALGSRPVVPRIEGIGSENVFSAEDVYYDPSKAGANTAIIGGGLVGMELGIHLAMMGRKVSIIEVRPELTYGSNHLHAVAVDLELKRLGIEIYLDTKALGISKEGVLTEGQYGRKLIKADTVIYAVGQKPLREEADALRFCAPVIYQIGDCLMPRTITEATSEAHSIAMDIGRFA